MCVVLFPVPQRIGILLVKQAFVDTSGLLHCYFASVLPVPEYTYPVWGSGGECNLQLLERQVYSVARHCRDQSFLLLCHRHNVASLSILYNVNSNSNHGLFSEFPSASTRVRHLELRLQLIYWSLKYQGVERPSLIGLSFRPRFEFGMTFPTMCLIPECWMGSRVQSTVGCFPEMCFLQFSVAEVLVVLRKQYIINFVFLTWACAAGFNNIILLLITPSEHLSSKPATSTSLTH